MNLAEIFPYSCLDAPWLALIALILDLCFGDPDLPWRHPVCYLGKALDWLSPRLRRLASLCRQHQSRLEKCLGFLALFLMAGISFVPVFLLLRIPFWGAILAIYLAWAGLAFGCLTNTGKIVLERVESGDLPLAREGVAWLVSRDVSQLDQPMLRKTLADTLAENFTDAFLAPYFWLLLTGPAGLWCYKAVSTMDSQWGYLTPKWRNLGYACAKADDCLAWLPARLAPLILHFASCLVPTKFKSWQGYWPGYATIRADARGMTSPNSGWSMSACAWLCQGPMAGPSIYFGQLVQKAWLGPKDAPAWTCQRLLALMRLMTFGAIVGGLSLWLLLLLINSFLNSFMFRPLP